MRDADHVSAAVTAKEPNDTPADVEAVAGGVWQIRVPVPFGPTGGTLVYLLEADDGPVLVDTGWDTPGGWDALTCGITATGHDITDVRGVVVTHFHPDHHGMSGRVRHASGAWVAMHPLEAEMVALQRDGGVADFTGITAAFFAAGAPGAAYGDVPDALPVTLPPPAVPDRLLADGDFADIPGRRLRALWTPGHSPGHLSFHLEDARLLMTGDHILPRITPHVGLWMQSQDADPLGDFLESLERLIALEVDEVLPAHEYRFAHLRQRIDELKVHHDERLAAIEMRLAQGPATLWEVAESMPWEASWREVPAVMRHVALGEAGSHVRRLESLGRVVRMSGEPPARFALADV